MPDRDRPFGRTGGQAGSIYFRLRRGDLLSISPGRSRRGLATEDFTGSALQPRRQPAAVLYRLLESRFGHSQRAGRQEQAEEQIDGGEPAFRQRPRSQESASPRD